MVRRETFSLLGLQDQAPCYDIEIHEIISQGITEGEQPAKKSPDGTASSGVPVGLEDQLVECSQDTLHNSDTTEFPKHHRSHIKHIEHVSISPNTRSASLLKYASLLVKLAHEFPESAETLLQTINPSLPRRKEKRPSSSLDGIHVFVDHSNVGSVLLLI